MMRCVVVDDEKPAREELIYLINASKDFEVVSQYENGQKYLIENKKTDVVFLDINMPGLTGIEVAEILMQRDDCPRIIFITAYDEFAVKAFELNAVDYILKPISDERLHHTLRKLKEMHDEQVLYNDQIVKLFNQIKQADNIEHICIHHNGKIIPVKMDEIIYIQAENKGVMIQSTKGCFITAHKLKALEEQFKETNLLRCHKSFMINTDYIEQIEPWFNRTYNVLLKDTDEKIPISRHYVQAFNDKMHIT